MTSEWLLYRDGALTLAEREELTRHLSDCASCRARLADAEVLGALVGEALELQGATLPRGFTDNVMKEIRARTQPEQGGWSAWFPRWRWVALGGLALAAAVATVILPLISRSHGAPYEEQAALQVENEAHIHSLSVDSPDTHPMILETAEGHTVILMISDSQFAGDAGETP
jgi:anti-sigma factor RsiW